MIVRVWGARGSLSAPGPATVGYGGNTSCVEVELADGTILILDAGSGIRELGQRLLEREHGTRVHLPHAPPSRPCGRARLLRAALESRLEAQVLGAAVNDGDAQGAGLPISVATALPDRPFRSACGGGIRGRPARAVARRQRSDRGPDGRASRSHARLPDRGGRSCARLRARPRAVPDRRARRQARSGSPAGRSRPVPTSSCTTRSTQRRSTRSGSAGGIRASATPQPSPAPLESANWRCSTTIPCARTASSRRSTTR